MKAWKRKTNRKLTHLSLLASEQEDRRTVEGDRRTGCRALQEVVFKLFSFASSPDDDDDDDDSRKCLNMLSYQRLWTKLLH